MSLSSGKIPGHQSIDQSSTRKSNRVKNVCSVIISWRIQYQLLITIKFEAVWSHQIEISETNSNLYILQSRKHKNCTYIII
jgi:hypothetical protein